MTQCDSCAYYAYDEEYGEYFCTADMDEDEVYRTDYSPSGYPGRRSGCAYYRDGDEYSVVRHQN